MGRGQNVGPDFDCCRRGHPCFINTWLVLYNFENIFYYPTSWVFGQRQNYCTKLLLFRTKEISSYPHAPTIKLQLSGFRPPEQSENANCLFCNFPETAEHYLLHCNNYDNIRLQTIYSLGIAVNVNILLKGCPLYDDITNRNIFSVVQEFIRLSKRFE